MIQTATRTSIEARRQADYEGYVRWEEEKRRDELTDTAERLRLPMEHSFNYTLRDGELFSEFGLSLDQVIQGGLRDSELKAQFDPDWHEETTRRELQVDELVDIKQLQVGEKLIMFTPIPDDVRTGESKIQGYHRDTMRMLVRVSERKSDADFSITSFSLDRSDRRAMQAAARAVGSAIGDDETSNDIVANRVRMTETYSSKEIVNIVRNAYDFQLSSDLGGEWYAGRPPISPQNSYQHVLESVEKHPDIFEEHMRGLARIESQYSGVLRADTLEQARYNFAARIDALRENKQYETAADAGAQAMAEGKHYDGDCPPGVSTVVQAEKLGLVNSSWQTGEIRECVNCPLCSKVVSATKTKNGIKCGTCEKELVTENGRSRIIDHKANKILARSAIPISLRSKLSQKPKLKNITFKTVTGVGTATKQAYQNGQLIAQGRKAEEMARSYLG